MKIRRFCLVLTSTILVLFGSHAIAQQDQQADPIQSKYGPPGAGASGTPGSSQYGPPGSGGPGLKSAQRQSSSDTSDQCFLTGQVEGEGRFVGVYCKPSSARYYAMMDDIIENGYLEWILDDLNGYLRIPENIHVGYYECGQPNAFYNPEARSIIMCFELYDEFEGLFQTVLDLEGEELDNAVNEAELFVFYHELGHALIHVLDLPITGQEEDAVDQLATYVATDGVDEGASTVINGALSFLTSAAFAEGQGYGPGPLWGEHDLGEQRFYNIVCWLYGSNPEAYAELVNEDSLPQARAERCPGEWSRLEKAWSTLLANNFRMEGEVEAASAAPAQSAPPQEPQFLFPFSDTHEYLLQGYPPGWVIGHEQQADNGYIVELIPEGEQIENWSHLITVIIAQPGTETPGDYAVASVQQWSQACPEVSFEPLVGGTQNYYPFEVWSQYCPMLASSGKPEFTLIKAVQSGPTLYIIQKAFRYQPSEEELIPWAEYFATINICNPQDAQRNCMGDGVQLELTHQGG